MIQTLLPEVRFVFIHRHPLKVVNLSWRALQQGTREPLPYLALLSQRYQRTVKRRWRLTGLRMWMDGFPKLAIRHWVGLLAGRCRAQLACLPRLDRGSYIEVEFEQLCSSPNGTIQSILERWGAATIKVDLAGMICPRSSRMDEAVSARTAFLRGSLDSYLQARGYRLREADG